MKNQSPDNHRPLKIYIAGPYSASDRKKIESNVINAVDAGIRILDKGHYPFIPHLTHYVDVRAEELNKPISWEEYVAWDLVWLNECDALLYLSSSPGADIELEEAKRKNKVIFFSLDEIPVNR